jgi:hypothetical protein
VITEEIRKDERKGRRNSKARQRKDGDKKVNTYGKMLWRGWRSKRNLGGKYFLLIPVVLSGLQCLEKY